MEGEDSDVLTEEDRKKETVYGRDIHWGGETANQTHRDEQWLHTPVGIWAALWRYIIITEQEEPRGGL